MHLIWENLIKNLILLWTGEFKGLDQGHENYQIPENVWKAIGKATAESGTTIPSAFGPRTPDLIADRSSYNADAWSFWTLFVGPVLLARRFSQPKYYKHFVKLVKLLHTCLQFEITRTEIAALRQGFIDWVKEYERMYYQYSPARLSACPVTIHALLHIADGIEAAGPVWASWAFPMERYCARLQPALRSRRFPDASLSRYVVSAAQLQQIKLMYDLTEELALTPHHAGVARLTVPEYPTCALLAPRRVEEIVDHPLREKIVGALATRFDTTAATVRHILPQVLECWGRVQILPDGDTIRASEFTKTRDDSRDATYVRYETLVDINASYARRQVVLQKRTFYGQLQHLVVLRLTPFPHLGIEEPTTIIWAAIRSCVVEQSHNDLDIHFYSQGAAGVGALDVIDVTCVQCLVGRVPDGQRWAIIDRSGMLSRAVYAEDQ
ncbi:hypothetical protein B0H21DRAFT_841828 [Amylocystis lapponica]|nr:hypothetical protein B0H21DRAFT_841828 [Amylocystis lapponica]